MKKIKILIFTLIAIISMTSFISAKEKKKTKTINKNGILYKINSSSKHMTSLFPMKNKKKRPEKLSATGYKFHTTFGHISPLGDNLRVAYNPSYSIGCILELPHTFSLFKKVWNISVSGKHTRFNTDNNTTSNIMSFSLLDFMAHTSTKIGKIHLNLAMGLSKGTSTIDNHNTINEFGLSAKFDIGYAVIEKNDFDLILNLSFQASDIGPMSTSNAEKGTTELMGLNLQFGKNINF